MLTTNTSLYVHRCVVIVPAAQIAQANNLCAGYDPGGGGVATFGKLSAGPTVFSTYYITDTRLRDTDLSIWTSAAMPGVVIYEVEQGVKWTAAGGWVPGPPAGGPLASYLTDAGVGVIKETLPS